MKHSTQVTFLLIGLFFLSQLVGILVLDHYIEPDPSAPGGLVLKQLPTFLGYTPERPKASEGGALVSILGALLLGTALIFLLIRYKKLNIWKAWFFVAIAICLNFALGAFLPPIIANPLAILLAALKVLRPATILHNITELFVYSGLASIFIDMMTIPAGVFLLLFISAYDAYAVWHSRHMVSLAQFQAQSGLFAGLAIPTPDASKGTPIMAKRDKKGSGQAIAVLGGGDMGFPLLFTGAVLKTYGAHSALLVSLCATIALGALLFSAKKEKFYPAMPFISLGLFTGLALVLMF